MKMNDFLQRNWKFLFGILLIYFVVWHYFFLGYTSWDAFVFRIPPIVELLQHGNFQPWKFESIFAQHPEPFFEFLHLPFLYLFGLPGLYFSFSLVLLPFATVAVYLFAREATLDSNWATYTALSFLALPFVNEQPFAGYRDFAVVGSLALFLYSLIKLTRPQQLSIKNSCIFLIATLLFSFSRQHTPYIAVILFFSFQFWVFFDRNNSLGNSKIKNLLVVPFGLLLMGLFPSFILQAKQFLIYGSPIYPYQFQAFGIQSETGIPLKKVLEWGGLIGENWSDMGYAFIQGWLWIGHPPTEFYDSRNLGVGISFWVLLLFSPLISRHLDRFLCFLMFIFVGISLVVQDFWLPRFSMTLILGLCLLLGGAFSISLKNKWGSLYGILLFLSLLQLLGRPAYVAASIHNGSNYYSRANLSESSVFLDKTFHVVEVHPDWDADLIVVYPLTYHYVLTLYGKNLSNQIVATVNEESSVTEQVCRTIYDRALSSSRRVIVVDHNGKLARHCELQCLTEPWGCLAYGLQKN